MLTVNESAKEQKMKKNAIRRFVAGTTAALVGAGLFVLGAPLAASASPYGCHSAYGDTGWNYGADAYCSSGSGRYRVVAICSTNPNQTVYGNWVTAGHYSEVSCGIYPVKSSWVVTEG